VSCASVWLVMLGKSARNVVEIARCYRFYLRLFRGGPVSVLASNLLTLREWSAVVHYNPEIQAARDETLRFIASALIGRFA